MRELSISRHDIKSKVKRKQIDVILVPVYEQNAEKNDTILTKAIQKTLFYDVVRHNGIEELVLNHTEENGEVPLEKCPARFIAVFENFWFVFNVVSFWRWSTLKIYDAVTKDGRHIKYYYRNEKEKDQKSLIAKLYAV